MSTPTGIAHPFRFGSSGGINTVSGDDKIKTNLKAIVRTALLERVMRPTVGTVSYTLILRNVNPPGLALIKQLVAEAVVQYEPRVQLLSVSISRVDRPNVGTTTVVTVGYMIPASRQEQSISLTM